METTDFGRHDCSSCESVDIKRPAVDQLFTAVYVCEPCREAYWKFASRLWADGNAAPKGLDRDELLAGIRRNLP